MKHFCAVVALALLLALSACGNETPPVGEATVTTTDTEIKIAGVGRGVSEGFRIKSRGQYKLYWKSSKEADGPNDPSGCPIKGEMVSATRGIGYHRNLATEGVESASMPGMMESRPFNLEAQSYAVKIETPCEWVLTLERQLSR